MSLLIVGLDITALNVALPALRDDLGASTSQLQWIIDAYTVVMASLLTLMGSTADRLGRRRTFLAGLTVFTAGSILCSLAPSSHTLIAFRALQAIGAAALNPVAMSIVTNTFTDPRERAQAVGIWGAVFGVSMALGPIVGGALVSAIGWEAIFWLNVPVGLAAIVLTLRFIPESKAEKPRRVDPVGQLIVIALLASVTFGIIEESLPALGVAAVALVALLLYEPRREEPLIDLRFFGSIPFAASIAACVCAFAAFGGFLFLNTLYLQGEQGHSPVVAGLLTAPVALMIVLASPLSGRIVGGRGPRVPLLIAGACLTVGALILTTHELLIVGYVVLGLGMGFVNAPITNAAVSGMPRAQAGVAAALATTSRQVGQTLGVAVVGTLHHGAWWTLVVCGAAVLILGAVATTSKARESARRTAAALNPEALAT